MQQTIALTQREAQLRSLLLDVSSFIDKAGATPEPTVLRWAGGWVRDKLLGNDSHDIDVAINTMTGVDFARRMCEYCSKPEAIDKHSIKADDIGSLHNVARNPDKSKHLETAMLRIFGLDLDLVNLRKETYADDSRNPQIEFGTPEEDALRRDATINALFYNLQTDSIEDFTSGLSDMAARVVRTPLSPLQTFMDDPLRVLRLVRFASHLGFTIDPNARKVMSHGRVLDALRKKISRERVGTELEKMLKGESPLSALRLISELDLYDAIFTDVTIENSPRPDASRLMVASSCLQYVLQHSEARPFSKLLIKSSDAEYYAWCLAAVSPWMKVDWDVSLKRKPKAPPPVSNMAREGFKAPNKLTDLITASCKHRLEITRLKAAALEGDDSLLTRERLGMAIRNWEAHGGSWTIQVLNAILVEAMDRLNTWCDNDDRCVAFLSEWRKFLDRIIELDVYNAPDIGRLVDGRALSKLLGVKPGRWTGAALDACMAWQLRNPGRVDAEGAIEELKNRREELGIPRS